VAADGTILTGADRGRVPAAFEPVLADAAAFADEWGASLYAYGPVPSGTVRPGSSDIDLLPVGLRDAAAGERLPARYVGLCRGVEIAAAQAADLAGDTHSAYGFAVFPRHYCVHLAGPDPSAGLPAFPADARAARGFNRDIAWHCQRWRQALESGTASADLLGVRAARKTLLAVAGLVSVRDPHMDDRPVARRAPLRRDHRRSGQRGQARGGGAQGPPSGGVQPGGPGFDVDGYDAEEVDVP
jgi:hypothetical protein